MTTDSGGEVTAILQEGLVRQAYPGKRSLSALGMGCALASKSLKTPGGIPYSERGEEPLGSWFGPAVFAGDAVVDLSTSPPRKRQLAVAGVCSVTVGRERILAIVDADDDVRKLFSDVVPGENGHDGSIWIAVGRSAVQVETKGQQGLLSKRPVIISLAGPEWDIHLREVGKFNRASTPELAGKHNSLMARGENSLLEALQG